MLEPTWTAVKHHRRLHQIIATLVRFGAQDVVVRLGLTPKALNYQSQGLLAALVDALPGK